jgi:ABC-2 type transport system permease protein
VQDDAFRGGASAKASKSDAATPFLDSLTNLFSDPTAALVQKELRSLLRMPRFRVALGMACIFSTVLFLPLLLRESSTGNSVWRRDLFPLTNLYALLLLSDSLLLNIFGTDRSAVQLYFLSPVPLAVIFKAKNLVAWVFILVINALVAGVTLFFAHLSVVNIAAGFLASAVAAIHLMWAGNLLSVIMPRPADPSSTLQRKGSSKVQLWIFFCTLGMAVLVGFAYLARWAFDSDWALLAVLVFEFIIGYVVYRVALDSAVARGISERERILDALSKTSSPIGGSLG